MLPQDSPPGRSLPSTFVQILRGDSLVYVALHYYIRLSVTGMRIRLDHTTPVPPFEQIRAQLALHVAAGRLTPGDRLPAIRQLADELDVSTNTIARAYRELINAGIAEAAGRRGTRITAAPPVAHDVAQRSEQIEASS